MHVTPRIAARAPNDTFSESLRVLEQLVAFDTTSAKSNLALIDWVEGYLAPLGGRVLRIAGQEPGKYSLYISFGPLDRPGYILSGHCDTVPVEGQAWSGDPFALRRQGGALIGRGAVDMKGFLAVCLAHAPRMASAPLRRPLHIAISHDEEVGCVGVRKLIEHIVGLDPKPLGCFVGEPTNMRVVCGHKGKKAFHTRISGTPGHSSLAPRFVNAIEYAARLVEHIRQTASHLARNGARDETYDIPVSTLLTTLISGGTASNIVPQHCDISWECRFLRPEDIAFVEAEISTYVAKTLQAEMQAIAPETKIVTRAIVDYPGLDSDAEAHIMVLAQRLIGKAPLSKVAFGTEAGLFANMAGIPAVVLGPGSIAQAHQPDEFIAESEIALCGDFIARLIAHCCAEG